MIEVLARGEQLLDRGPLRNDIVKAEQESAGLAGIELEGAEGVGELEAVDDDAGVVGECVGLDDVHTPRSERTGDIGKEAAAVAGDDREIEKLAVRAQVELNRIAFEID